MKTQTYICKNCNRVATDWKDNTQNTCPKCEENPDLAERSANSQQKLRPELPAKDEFMGTHLHPVDPPLPVESDEIEEIDELEEIDEFLPTNP